MESYSSVICENRFIELLKDLSRLLDTERDDIIVYPLIRPKTYSSNASQCSSSCPETVGSM
jgi:hypothetical protein